MQVTSMSLSFIGVLPKGSEVWSSHKNCVAPVGVKLMLATRPHFRFKEVYKKGVEGGAYYPRAREPHSNKRLMSITMK